MGVSASSFASAVRNTPPRGLFFKGLIDTGFTRFGQIPLTEALSLGLPLEGTIGVTLADSSRLMCLTALARMTLEGEGNRGEPSATGVFVLSATSGTILLGMEFLRQFNLSLFVTESGTLVLEKPPG